MKAQRSLPHHRPHHAFTLVEVFVVIVCLVAVAAIVLPMLASRNRYSSKIGCVNQLKMLGLAARIFATDNEGLYPWQLSATNGGTKELFRAPGHVAPHFLALSNELIYPKILLCPEDRKRQVSTNFATLTDANVSYFIGLDATQETPNSILSGDRHLIVNGAGARPGLLTLTSTNQLGFSRILHPNGGCLLFGDGSVQQVTPQQLNAALAGALTPTNTTVRLLIP